MTKGKGLASRLRDRVDLQEPNVVDNGAGGRRTPPGEAKWRSVADQIPAEIIPLRGGEALDHLVQRAKQLWRVTIRIRPGITTAMRLAWTDPAMGPITANIRSAALNDTRDGIVMTAESGAGG